MNIPMELWYLILLLGIIILMFVILKRPIYEAMFVGFLRGKPLRTDSAEFLRLSCLFL